jgi:two-component system, sensor histidine kinase and response regulator
MQIEMGNSTLAATRFLMRYFLVSFFMVLAICRVSASPNAVDSLRNLVEEPGISEPERSVRLANLALYYSSRQPDSTVYFATEALRLAETSGSTKAAALAHSALGAGLQKKDDVAGAFVNFFRSVELARESSDHALLATNYRRLGDAYFSIRVNDEAMRYFLRAMEGAKASNESQPITDLLIRMGELLEAQGNYAEANQRYTEALDNSQKLDNNLQMRGLSHLHLGRLYRKVDKNTDAEMHLTQALEAARTAGDSLTEVQALEELGLVAMHRGKLHEGRSYLQRALQQYTDLRHSEGEARTHLHLAYLLMEAWSMPEARIHLDRALAIAEDKELLPLQRDVWLALTAYHEQRAHFREALQANRQFDVIHDRIINDDRERQLTELAVRYAQSAQEQENKFLQEVNSAQEGRIRQQKRNNVLQTVALVLLLALVLVLVFIGGRQLRIKRQLARQKAELEEMNTAKDKLLSVVAHDFKSPLNALKSMLNFIREGTIERKDMDKMIPAFQKELDYTGQLLDNILIWAKSQMTGLQVNPREFDLKSLIEYNTHLMLPLAQQKEITLRSDIPKAMPAFADEDMVQLVVRNLLSNAIKFTRPSGKVTVTGYNEEGHWRISVVDTGIGIRPEDQAGLFSFSVRKTHGTSNEKGTGLGLSLSREFIEKNNGRIWVSSEDGMGSTFSFTLPKA